MFLGPLQKISPFVILLPLHIFLVRRNNTNAQTRRKQTRASSRADTILDKKRGPMLLEINARPGLAIQTANRTGLLKVLD